MIEKTVKIFGKGGRNMRKVYLDNIRWITVVLVVIYHVILHIQRCNTTWHHRTFQ